MVISRRLFRKQISIYGVLAHSNAGGRSPIKLGFAPAEKMILAWVLQSSAKKNVETMKEKVETMKEKAKEEAKNIVVQAVNDAGKQANNQKEYKSSLPRIL